MNRPLGMSPFSALILGLALPMMVGGGHRPDFHDGPRVMPQADPMPEPTIIPPPAKPTVKRRSKAERRARNAKRRGKGK